MAEGSERIDAADNTPARSQILAALQARGAQPTGENMSRLLVANAQNPGVIPGVRNMPPVVSPGDPGFAGPVPPRGGAPRGGGPPRAAPDARPLPIPPAYVPPPPVAGAAAAPPG